MTQDTGSAAENSALDALLDILPDVRLRVRGSGTITAARGPAGMATVFDLDTSVGKSLAEALPAELGSLFSEAVARALDTGRAQSFSYTVTIKGREYAREARVARSAPDEALVLIRDLTALHRSEEAREESEQRFRAIFEAQFEAILLLDTEGRILAANQAARELAGVPSRGSLGVLLWEAVQWDEESRLLLQAAVENAAHGDFTRYNAEARTAERQVKVLDLSFKPVRADSGAVDLVIVEGRDISENVQIRREMARMHEMQQALRQSEARYRALFQAAGDAVLVYHIGDDGDPERLLDFNEAAVELYGYSREQLRRMTVRDLVDPAALRVADAIQRLRANSTARFDSVHVARDGRHIPVETVAELFLFNGRETVLAICRDVTARKATEEALSRAKDAAEAASRAKSAFLASMSHELRTPLNAVIGYSELLQEEAEDAGQLDFLPELEKIRAAGRQLLSLVNDVLDLSKIEAGKMELHLSAFDVCALAAEVAGTVQPLVEKNNNRLTFSCEEGMGLIHADAIKVRQVLFNLLGNAAKFTSEGEISLRIGRDAEAGEVVMAVQDTGIGMNEEQVAHLFEAFYRGGNGTIIHEGTGLGLAITMRLLRLMGGQIKVESEVGVGSVFTVRLPSQMDPAAAEQERLDFDTEGDAGAPTHSGDRTVLVIDDDEAARDLLSQYLRKEGFGVVTASSGEEGLHIARTLRPVAITTDVMMPGMDGWDVLTAIKDDPDLADTPVVVMTIGGGAHRAYALGAAEFMTKPINRHRLASVLARFCPEPGGCSILIVEDDEAMRELLRRSLESHGYVVHQAVNGRHALQQLVAATPAVILMDLMMPEMNGFELLEELRKHEEWRELPVVVMTSKDLTSEDRGRLHGSVETILQKSTYNREDLLREVSRLVTAHVRKPD